MAKKKFSARSTLIGRMGFKDRDLKSLLHDQIVMWLYEDPSAIENILNLVLALPALKILFAREIDDWDPSPEKEQHLKLIPLKAKRLLEREPAKYNLQFKRMEVVVENDKGYDVGFLDLVINCDVEHSKFNSYRTNAVLVFKVKTGKITLGELLRQLNIYSKYFKARDYASSNNPILFKIVVTPKHHYLKQYAKSLEEHGWHFYEAPFSAKENSLDTVQSLLDGF